MLVAVMTRRRKALQLYYCGGKSVIGGSGPTAHCQRFEGGAWRESKPMGNVLYKHACASLNDYGIVCGGDAGNV